MNWQFTPYTLPLLIIVIVSAALALSAWRRRTAPGALPFLILMLAVAEWSLGYALRLSSANLPHLFNFFGLTQNLNCHKMIAAGGVLLIFSFLSFIVKPA